MGLLQQPVKWTMTSLDDGTYIEGQFRPTGLTENISAQYAEQATLGHSQPVLQFIRGELETISFQAKCWAYSQGLLGTPAGKFDFCDIEEQVDAIKAMPRIDPDLGRPHVWVLTVGESFQQQVVCRSVGGIRYDMMRPAQGGSLRGVLFQMDLLRYVPVGASVEPAESLIYRAKTGDYYEAIAASIYGKAILGEALRRRNPEYRTLSEGTPIHVPPRRSLERETRALKPQTIALADNASVRALTQDTLDVHAGPYVSITLLEGVEI
jgi:hypothetical protein